MVESSGNGDINKISPQDRKLYEQEYKNGAKLFQETLGDYAHANSKFQKQAFKNVMDEAMDVLNQSARALNEEKLLQQNAKIQKDFEKFKEQDTPEMQQKLNDDLNQAKNKVK